MEFNENIKYITAYRSLDAHEQQWMIDTHNGNGFQITIFGGVVLEFLNLLRSNLNCLPEESLFDDEEFALLKWDAAYWEGKYSNLIDALLAKDYLAPIVRYKLYEEYKGFALGITGLKRGRADICRKKTETEIIFKGYEILEDKKEYEVFRMPDASFLFALDLWNILFQKNLKLKFKCCEECNDFIWYKNNNQKYCPICKEIKNRSNKKKSNATQQKDIIKRIKKRITARFTTTQKYANDQMKYLSDFVSQTGYIEARLSGEERQYNPDYNNTIQTEEEYREWLIAYEEHSRIYKKSQKK